MSFSRREVLACSSAFVSAGPVSSTQTSRRFNFVQWDVFSAERFSGNPLTVFLDARSLSDSEMQALTNEINQQETTFVLPRDPQTEDERGIRVRIFQPATVLQPGTELPFAGHPTLGTAMALRSLQLEKGKSPESMVLDLKVGPVPVSFSVESNGAVYGEMRQHDPQFGKQHDPAVVAHMIGLTVNDLNSRAPVQTVSTGLPFVLVPVRSLDSIRKIKIDWTTAIPYLTHIDPNLLFYCFTFETSNRAARLHARGIYPDGEDAATGSAAGCTTAWAVYHGLIRPEERILIEQGIEMKRPSKIFGMADKHNGQVVDVRVGGNAVRIASGQYEL